jgi:hypothetical protein
MRFMVIVKASRDTEAGVMPGTEMDCGEALTPELREQEERLRAGVGRKWNLATVIPGRA